ncbi:MAG: hypothetical protein GY754_07550, partial [bacterium]|nr:hypothetical protein [bacterium]
MKKFKKGLCNRYSFLLIPLILLILVTSLYASNDPEQNKADYRSMAVSNPTRDAAPIFAYEGLAIDEDDITSLLSSVVNDETGDFKLAQLVRILYLTGDYDDMILPTLENIDYWLTQGEDQYCYWSENHMILWTSTAYLLQQREGWTMDSSLAQRLDHYLDLKLEYGFYEFFSSTYFPFSLAGLLNLADFAEDESIRSRAEEAAKILMKNVLLLATDKGTYFPAAGRNYSSKYTSAHGHNHNCIIRIPTGLGEPRTTSSYIGAFLSTTGIDLSDVENSWQESLNTTFTFGHSQSEKLTVHAGLPRTERTVFQWSAGGYFHPDTADDTTYTVDYYDLENNKHFSMFQDIPNFPDSWSDNFAKIGATFGRSSDISHATIDIYKNKGSALTSLQSYYAAYYGWQQWPWAATVDDIAVWTQSGEVKTNWGDRSKNNANTHLPYINQVDNVALIIYWPNAEIQIADTLNQIDTSVSLYWPTDRF